MSELRSSDLMGVLEAIEQRFPVGEWSVAGIPVWPLVRIRWFFEVWAAHYVSPAHRTSQRGGPRIRSMARGQLGGAMSEVRDRLSGARDTSPDLLFLSDGVSFAQLGEEWVERFCDPVIALARTRGLRSTLLSPTAADDRQRVTPTRFLQARLDRANIRGALRARLFPVPAQLPARLEVERFVVARQFGVAALNERRIVSDGCRLRAIADACRALLGPRPPRIAFLVSYYSLELMAFILACHEQAIPVVDLQHGVQGETHPAYAGLPPPPGGRHLLLPDTFWVWSSDEQEVIERWANGTAHKAIVGGNPWMSVWGSGSSWPQVSGARASATVLKQRSSTKPVVLVTLQYGLSDREQLEPLARLLRVAGSRFSFWVRLHPAMLERRAEVKQTLAGEAFCTIDAPTDLPLPALLQCCDAHLTHSSSSVIEAALVGVRSIVTSQYGAELFASQCRDGIAVVDTGPAEQLAATLGRVIAEGRRQGPTSFESGESALTSLLAEAA